MEEGLLQGTFSCGCVRVLMDVLKSELALRDYVHRSL